MRVSPRVIDGEGHSALSDLYFRIAQRALQRTGGIITASEAYCAEGDSPFLIMRSRQIVDGEGGA